jgi:glyoxylase-like metal-dependent hydrolase (beta-lactamase superfamily II)
MMKLLPSFLALCALHATAMAAFEQVAPHLFRWSGTCNAYLLREGDAGLLIDLGDGELLAHLPEIGVRRIEWVLLTGHHRELLQGADHLDRASTQLAAPRKEQPFLETPTAFRKWNPRLGDPFSVHGSSYVRPPQSPVHVDRWLDADEVFQWRGHSLRCIATPGHSPGGMTYLLQESGTSAMFPGGLIHDGARMSNWFDSEWDYGFAKGLDALIQSADILAALGVDSAFPAQGPVIRNASAQLAQYRARLASFRGDYVRGYPVDSLSKRGPHPATTPTKAHSVVQVTPHLFMFGPEMAGKNFSILIADSGHGLLLDCGLFSRVVLERIISDLKTHLGLKKIDACWISHSHGDHFTLFPALKEHGVEFWTMDSIADKCQNPRYYDYPAMIGAYNAGFEAAKIDRILKPGEVIEWEGYKLHVDWMPGQTEFGNALWLELDGKRIVFTGDNLFGDPADPAQDGHECVVARNSAITEEGYLVAAQYLQRVKPDIIMGAHSVLMTEPSAFIERYHAWALRIIRQYRELLPDADYEYLFDPYWVSAYPYRADLASQDSLTVQITVRNFRNRPQQHRVALRLPAGCSAEPAVLEGTVPAKGRQSYPVKISVIHREALQPGVQIVPMDITLDGRRHGELFDFILQGRETQTPATK